MRAVLLLCVLVPGAAAAQDHAFAGGNGSSCEEAVVPQVRETSSVVEAEYQWLRKAYGGGVLVRQAFGASHDGRRRYDLIAWRKPDGKVVEVCFDVTMAFEPRDPHSPPR
jgi:hypothetical protein